VEVKYRRLQRSALQAELLCHVQAQTADARRGWSRGYFDAGLKRTQAVIRRHRLARVLQFYADKARRHGLEEPAHGRLSTAINKLQSADTTASNDQLRTRGYVFCPEHSGAPTEIADDGDFKIVLFGPQDMPDRSGSDSMARGPVDAELREDLAPEGVGLEITPAGIGAAARVETNAFATEDSRTIL